MITSITRLCRRAARSPLSWISLATLLLIGGYQGYCRQLNALPTLDIPAAPALPNPNALDYFVRAGEMSSEPDVNSDAEREAMIAKNEPALTVLRAGLAYPFQMYTNPEATKPQFSYFAKFRSLGRILAAEQKTKLIRGDFVGATVSGLDGLQFAIKLQQGGSVIDGLVGTACEQVARRYMWVEAGHLTADEAASAAGRLEGIDAARPTFADSLLSEEWRSEKSLLSMLRAESVGKIVSELQPRVDVTTGLSEPPSTDSASDNRQLFTLSKRQVVADYIADMDTERAAARLPYSAPVRGFNAPSDPISRNFIWLNIRSLYFAYTVNQTHDRLLTAVLALKTYRLSNGAYPESLDNLVGAKILAHVPSDAFAPTAGVPLRYRKLANGTYLLYSIGPDGVDNDGAPIAVKTARPSHEQQPKATDMGDWVVGANTPTLLVDPATKGFQRY